MKLRGLRRRFALAIALAVSAVLAVGGSVLADTETGQHGHYSFHDDSVAEAPVVCVYSGSNPYLLVKVIIKAPWLWWPDTNSSSNTEHGKVGWRGIIRVSLPGAYGPFNQVKQTGIQKATAYEDNPAYDITDKAPLTKMTLSFNPSNYSSHPDAYISVRFKANWYRADGSVLGSVTHDGNYYKYRNIPGIEGGTTACKIKSQVVSGSP